MAGLTKLAKASTTALNSYMGLDEEETLLIITDEGQREIGMALFEAGKKITKDILCLEMPVTEKDGDEPPDVVAGVMKDVDVIVAATTNSLASTLAVKAASKLGVRTGLICDMSVDSMVRSMSADHKKIAKQTESLKKAVYGVAHLRITTKAGTDLKLLVKKRKIKTNTGVFTGIGDVGEMPSGMIMLAPIDGKTNGKVVIDGSVTGFGLLENPITMTIKASYAERISGDKEAKELSKLLSKVGEDARSVGLFGMGANYKAKLTGNLVEDTKVLGTVHLGLGNNNRAAGKIDIDFSIDCVIKEPTIYCDEELIMEDGIPLVK